MDNSSGVCLGEREINGNDYNCVCYLDCWWINCYGNRTMNKINYSIILALALQAIALVWFLSQQNSKIDTLYKEFETTNKKEVITNQVKMKLDLENLITEVKELRQVIKKLKNKDADIQKTNKKIIKQHDRLFELIEGNNSNRSYSYGD